MAEIKTQPPPIFSPDNHDLITICNCRQEFEVSSSVSKHFDDNVDIPIQQARIFNLAGSDFAKFVRQCSGRC